MPQLRLGKIAALFCFYRFYAIEFTVHVHQRKSDHLPQTSHKSPDYRRTNWSNYEEYLNITIDASADSTVVNASTVDVSIEKFTNLLF